jgi:VIT1/CCC1 family predicted Fe2+/Mn2+ transporter
MLSLTLSTVAFFVAGYFIKRYLDDMDIPKSVTRNLLVFCLALLIAYGVAFFVSWAAP